MGGGVQDGRRPADAGAAGTSRTSGYSRIFVEKFAGSGPISVWPSTYEDRKLDDALRLSVVLILSLRRFHRFYGPHPGRHERHETARWRRLTPRSASKRRGHCAPGQTGEASNGQDLARFALFPAISAFSDSRQETIAGKTDPFVAQLADLAGAIRTRREPHVPLREGAASLRLAIAARRSAETRQEIRLNDGI